MINFVKLIEQTKTIILEEGLTIDTKIDVSHEIEEKTFEYLVDPNVSFDIKIISGSLTWITSISTLSYLKKDIEKLSN